ncbi:MAG: molybdenum hydroxylase accessory protein YgfJ [Prolixibacteraceae bacterium]|nr:MAG: molybdenum hydroxylase accessory protein YgfJ [Prolixibacteraceae bacterium]
MNKIWAIILAAGASTRMKRQKLLLSYNGKTIIETVVENVACSVNSKILIVLGSHREQIQEQLVNYQANFCVNENYMNGMLSSVICGFSALPADAKAALIFLGDQPQIPPQVAGLVIETWLQSKKGIVMPTFNGRRGHPVLIETRYKTEIEKLDPNKGLRTLSEKFKDDVIEVECDVPEILRDIDTPEEYEEISKK